MRHRKVVINGSLVVAVVVLAALGYFTVTGSSASAPTGVRTAAVTQGDVSAAVSATGNVTSAMNLGVSFTDCAGPLTAIDVKPGQVVTAGQSLATVDPGKAQTALNNAQAQLAAVQTADYTGGATVGDAVLNSVGVGVGGTPVVTPAVYTPAAGAGASGQLAADEAALIAAQNAYKADSATTSALNKSVSKAQAVVTADTAAMDSARSRLAARQNATPRDSQAVAGAQADLDQAQHQLVTDESTLNSAEVLLTQTLTYDQQSIVYRQAEVTYDRGQGPAPGTAAPVAPSGGANPGGGGTKASVPAPVSGSSAGASTSGSKSASSGGSGTATPSQTALNNAQQAVAAAQQTLTDCTLTAPVGGTVITVNGVVGAPPVFSSGGSGSASSTGGSPSAGGGGSSGSSAGSSASAGSSTSSSGGFITLSDLAQMQIKGAFSETDVSAVQAGQQAGVVFPAVTDADNPAGITAAGTVTGVDLSSATTNNVVTYGVTVSLSNPSPRIRLGQTGNVTVTTATQTGVLIVPTNAITALGPTKTVTVQTGSTNQVVPVQVGIAGNGLTQIMSGVGEGQKLVLPSATPSTSSSGGFPRGGGGGAAGAGGVAGRLGGGS